MREFEREANVVVAKCNHSKRPYGIRMEKMSEGAWHCTWAFKINEQSAKNEGYDTSVSGRVEKDAEYPLIQVCPVELKWMLNIPVALTVAQWGGLAAVIAEI